MKTIRVITIILFHIIAIQAICTASDKELSGGRENAEHIGMMGVGFQYLGLSFRYYGGKLTYEAKGVVDGAVFGYGPRLYYNFNPRSNNVFYIGGEYSIISGKTEYQKLEGCSVGAFIGMEMFIDYNTSLSLDIGPYSTSLRSEYRDISVTADDIVCTISFCYYF